MCLVTQSEDLNTPPLSPKKISSDTLLCLETSLSDDVNKRHCAPRRFRCSYILFNIRLQEKGLWIFDGGTHSFCVVKPISIDFLGPYSTVIPTPSGSKKRTFLSFTTVHKWRSDQCSISLPRHIIVVDGTPQLRINKHPPTPPQKKIVVISVSTVRRNRTERQNAFFVFQWHHKLCVYHHGVFSKLNKIVYILLGISPASNCSWPTFRNPVSVPSSKAGCRQWSVKENREIYTRVRV